MDLSQIDELIARQVELLDAELARILGTDHPFLKQLNDRVMAKPGKRLRPKLLFLCTRMLGYEGGLEGLYAAVFELIHTATLIHDDIIDEAKTRRGQITMNKDLGNTLTVLYGDLLYTKAHSVAIQTGNLAVLHTITWVSERMIEGELLQNRVNFDTSVSAEVYFDILRRKTSFLFAGTTKAAALLANCDEGQVRELHDYGFNLGTSFQLIDDLLDYAGSEDELGKPVMQDLREGKVTLPIIKMLNEDHSGLADRLRAFWAGPFGPVPADLLEANRLAGALAETKALARSYAAKAVENLKCFPDNRFREILMALPLRLLNRTK